MLITWKLSHLFSLAQSNENHEVLPKKLLLLLSLPWNDEKIATYIHIDPRSIKVKHTGIEIKLSIQREFDVLCLSKAMLFTWKIKKLFIKSEINYIGTGT